MAQLTYGLNKTGEPVIEWTLVLNVGLTVLGAAVTSVCAVATLYLRNNAAGFESRITLLEVQSAKCEEERAVDKIILAARNELLSTEWPSDDFTHDKLVEKVHRASSAKGITVTIEQVGLLIKHLRKDHDGNQTEQGD